MYLFLAFFGCLGLQPSKIVPLDSGDTAGGTTTAPGSFGGFTFPAELDLGAVELGEGSISGALTLTNSSDGNIKLTEVQLDGSEDFSASYTSVPWVIGPGGQYVITISFEPESSGAQVATLKFAVDGTDGYGTVLVHAEGTTAGTGDGGGGDGDGGGGDGGGGGGDLSLSASSLSFGSVTVGATGSQTLTLTNNTGGSVAVSSATTTNSAFTISGFSTPTNLANGASQSMTVTFRPTTETSYAANLNIATDVGTKTVSLSGTGGSSCSVCAPVIDVDAGTSMEFFSVFGIADTKTVTVRNVGDRDLTVRTVTVTNESIGAGSFSVSGFTSGTTVSAGSSTSFSVSYTCSSSCLDLPNSTLDWNILHILSNDTSTPDWAISLSGAGL